MQNILIYGAGGFGMEVAWLIEDINRVRPTWQLVGFIDDDATKWGQKCNGGLAINSPNILRSLRSPHARAIAIGDSNQRALLVERLTPLNLFFPTLIHPSVIMSETTVISEGVIIAAGSILTVQVKIGSHTHVDTACSVGHQTQLGKYVRLNPKVSVAGNVSLEDGTYVGSGATIIQGLRVGYNSVIGAGSVVLRNLPENVVAVGNPAAVIKSSIKYRGAVNDNSHEYLVNFSPAPA
ncbi:MAG: acetyltransferase [Desulfomonilaceae bacterium]